MAEREKIWQVMKNPCGRPPRFKKNEELWNIFIEYCEWVDNNPWQIKDAQSRTSSTTKGDGSFVDDTTKQNSINQNVSVKQRAYTLYGFCAYAGLPKWGDFKRNYINKKGFLEVINAIENAICSYQIDGALLREFDSNLVSRLNGLADKQINEITGKNGSEFKFPKLTNEDLEILKKENGLA